MGLDAFIEVRAYDKKTHMKKLDMIVNTFRKYRHLQAYMEDLYYNKYDGIETFNTVPMEIDMADILDLEEACRNNMELFSSAAGLTEGISSEEKEKILKTTKWCKNFLEANDDPDEELEYVIVYSCWW